jgi:hypothetical protein
MRNDFQNVSVKEEPSVMAEVEKKEVEMQQIWLLRVHSNE